jgi:hypothetical protein
VCSRPWCVMLHVESRQADSETETSCVCRPSKPSSSPSRACSSRSRRVAERGASLARLLWFSPHRGVEQKGGGVRVVVQHPENRLAALGNGQDGKASGRG